MRAISPSPNNQTWGEMTALTNRQLDTPKLVPTANHFAGGNDQQLTINSSGIRTLANTGFKILSPETALPSSGIELPSKRNGAWGRSKI